MTDANTEKRPTEKDNASNHAEGSKTREVRLSLGPHVLSHQSAYGNGIDEELSKYRIESEFKNGKAEHLFSAKIPTPKERAFVNYYRKQKFIVGSKYCCPVFTATLLFTGAQK